MLTVPALFTRDLSPVGPYRCFYCGCPCDDTCMSREFVKDSFTGRCDVVAPGSAYVCQGCVACLQESIEINARPSQRVRNYSWVLTATSKIACTKADVKQLLRKCLTPPSPPFAIVLADSGQKHLLYRGVVNHQRHVVTVLLETERITYRPDDLVVRVDLTKRLIAATGKPALAEPPAANFAIRVCEYWTNGTDLLAQWEPIWQEPLSRLAAWLSPKKEDCIGEYPSDVDHRTVSKEAGRRGRSAAPDRQPGRSVDAETGSDPLLFDLG